MDNSRRGESFSRDHNFENIISLANLLISWKEFKRGKTKNPDVQKFAMFLEDNLFELHQELEQKTYKHSNYTDFYLKDPKLRHIHKAQVRDRVLHHAIYRILYPIFDKSFIYDSYSCRNKKGTHNAVLRLEKFCRKISSNYTKSCYCLKCDVRKYFDTIDHKILFKLIKTTVKDENALWLINEIIFSFYKGGNQGKGLPLGNLTSQLFANIYLNELDKFIKHRLKAKFYLRYTDDFIIVHQNEIYLKRLIPEISEFLKQELKLDLHPQKVTIRKIGQGIDFLGYVALPHYKILRTKTKRRILKKLEFRRQQAVAGEIAGQSFEQVRQSYLGVLSHCYSNKLRQELMHEFSI
ncbi:MAG: reverse transcriptase/maturase family protein [Candidatus Parcubacteria bacterium]|nr:reverse transcriptase/maturase family protein [Candidatus Parcubacteria bacterium]